MNNMGKTIPATFRDPFLGDYKHYRVRYNSPKMRFGSCEKIYTALNPADAKRKAVAELSKDHPNIRVMVVGER